MNSIVSGVVYDIVTIVVMKGSDCMIVISDTTPVISLLKVQAEEVKDCIDIMLKNGVRLDKKICNIAMEHVKMKFQY